MAESRINLRAPQPGPRYDRHNESIFRTMVERAIYDASLLRLGRPIGEFPDGETTPVVDRFIVFKTANTNPTTITAFNGGEVGQEVTIIAGDSNTTIQDGANLQLQGGGNFVMAANDTLTLVYDGTTWFETSRSVN